ncbi:hypothetical protein I4U23_005276 [Adineta vaga]|nr:hypothetical protein I4U23_005276 [Adineta vaga]
MDHLSLSLSILFGNGTTGALVYKQELKNNFIGCVINISHKQIDRICELVINLSSPYIRYIEQTGVDIEYHRQNIGSTLIALAKNQSQEDICTCVMH